MINIAVIGCGYWGPNIIRNIASSPLAKLVWVCDLDKNRMKNVLLPYSRVKQTCDFNDILNDKKLDAVAVVTPVKTHFPIAKACLDSGKHVLIEKPMAMNVQEGYDLIRIAKKNKLNIMCDHTFCYTGAVRKIKDIIETGILGKLYYFDSVRVNLGLFQQDVNVIWDLAPHDLSIMDFVVKEKPIQVSAQGISHAGNGLENIAYLTIGYEDSFIAHMHVNWLSPLKIRTTMIAGTEKMLVWNDVERSEKIKIYDKGIVVDEKNQNKKKDLLISYRSGDMYAPRIDHIEALSLVVNEFMVSIIEKRPPLTDGFSGLRVLKILEAAQKSLDLNGLNIKIDD